MGVESAPTPSVDGSWTGLARHDWADEAEFTTTLVRALATLDDVDECDVLYDHIDSEAVRAVLVSGQGRAGATEVRFDYEGYEIRITADGTIAAR